MTPRAVIEAIYASAIERVHAGNAVRSALRVESDAWLVAGAYRYRIPSAGVYAIAMGKAALPMVRATAEQLGTRLRGAIAVTKHAPREVPPRVNVLLGSHPTPDERSLRAGEQVLAFASEIPRGALVLCLISGGGSALVEALAGGTSLAELQRVTDALLRAGATINELNAVRSRMSRIKAGGLLDALVGCDVCNLVVSDVLGDPPEVIASGPTVPVAPDLDAETVLAVYGITTALPPPTPRVWHGEVGWLVVANLSMAIDAATARAAAFGYTPCVLSRSLAGEARHVAATLASIAADTAAGETSLPRPGCIVLGGETVVTVRGDGTGGRNTECALAAALRLRGVRGTTIGFLATDGDDGTTGLAGAIVDGTTVGPGMAVEARRALERNDSATFLNARGATVRIGPAETNVNDLVIALTE